jgi:hypothetical protein
MYQAFHAIVPLQPRSDCAATKYDIVGPVCESGDWLGRDRSLAVQQGDLLAVLGGRLLHGDVQQLQHARPCRRSAGGWHQAQLIRTRETAADTFRNERLLPESSLDINQALAVGFLYSRCFPHCTIDMPLELYRDKHHACYMFTNLIEEDGQAVQANQFLR